MSGPKKTSESTTSSAAIPPKDGPSDAAQSAYSAAAPAKSDLTPAESGGSTPDTAKASASPAPASEIAKPLAPSDAAVGATAKDAATTPFKPSPSGVTDTAQSPKATAAPARPSPSASTAPPTVPPTNMDRQTLSPAPKPAKGRGPLLPILGGVIAAGIGFGAAQFVPEGWPLARSNTQIAALEGRLAEQASQISALQQASQDPALSDRIAALESRPLADGAAPEAMAALSADVEKLRQDLADRPATGGTGSADLAPLEQQIADLRAQIAALPQAGTDEINALKAAVEEERRATEARSEALRTETEAAARSALLRGALLRVQAALDGGASLTEALDDITAAGLTVPPELAAQSAGVATLPQLQASFPQAARTALAASGKPAQGATFTDRVGAFFAAQTNMRSLTPQAGDGPDAVLSRAEALVASGELAPALAELNKLPDTGKASLAEWRHAAEARLNAVNAVADLAANLDKK